MIHAPLSGFRNTRCILLLLLYCLAAPFSYADDRQPLQVEAGYALDSMNNGYADWRSYFLDWEKTLGSNHAMYGSLRRTDRFSQQDTGLTAGIYYPLEKRWTLQAEGDISPTHNILSRWSTLGQLGYAFDDGWGAYLGVRHSAYNTALANTLAVTAERYWSNYRMAYTHSACTLAGSGSAQSGMLQFSRYYGERNSIGISVSSGSEIENLGSPRGILRTDVQATGLRGRHWLNHEWAAGYELATVKQGSLYTRNVFRLGLRRQF